MTAPFSSWPREAAPSPPWQRSTAPTGATMAGLIMDGSRQPVRHDLWRGGNGDGTVFELAKGSGTITTLASFNGTNGAEPGAADPGQRRRPVRHDRMRAAPTTTAPFSSWPRAADDHHPGLVQRHQRGIPGRRSDHGQQRQPLRHDRGGADGCTAPFSSSPRAAARSIPGVVRRQRRDDPQ